ncbi:MAG: ACT domain-containing protein [Clostridia bacterium]|nr:ACT domain-containing protein [Clostridia bacterium]
MTISQLSVFVENKQGTLSGIVEVLAKAGIDIRALTIADTTDFGILRLIVKNPEEAKKVLQEKNFVVTINQVVGVEVPDKVGGLARLLRLLDDALINIEYMYDFLAIKEEKAYIIIRVENNAKTVELLEKNGFRCIKDSDIVF